MGNNRKRYREMEQYMTYALIGLGIIFFVYLIAAGTGTIWLKVITAIVAILGSGLCIAYLYLTGELLRFRSRWMTVGFAAVILCVLVSLVLRYPSPNPYKKSATNETKPSASIIWQADTL